MDGNHLSKRLQKLADWVPAGSRLADIGSDHAYLPIYLVKHKHLPFAIAGEVAEGPLAHTTAAIAAAGLTATIVPRFGDGLAVIAAADQIDVITIAGMGGQLIVDILEAGRLAGKLANQPLLLLQPNREAHRVRRWLNQHDYRLVDEGLVAENQKRYEMMAARFDPQGQPLTATEIQFGRFTERDNPALFHALWTYEYHKAQRVLANLAQSDDQDAKALFTARVAHIGARLKEVTYDHDSNLY